MDFGIIREEDTCEQSEMRRWGKVECETKSGYVTNRLTYKQL